MMCRRHGRDWYCRCLWVLVAALPFSGMISAVLAMEKTFPFDHELRFDANPVRGSKRVPGLQISRDGAVEIDLWCASGKGRAVIEANTMTIVPTALQDNQCSQDRLRMDENLLTELTQVTGWRWEGNLIVLIGPKSLRFRPASN